MQMQNALQMPIGIAELQTRKTTREYLKRLARPRRWAGLFNHYAHSAGPLSRGAVGAAFEASCSVSEPSRRPLGSSWPLLGQSGASKILVIFRNLQKTVEICSHRGSCAALGHLLNDLTSILRPQMSIFALQGVIWKKILGEIHANSRQKPWQTFWATQTHDNQLGCGGFASAFSITLFD